MILPAEHEDGSVASAWTATNVQLIAQPPRTPPTMSLLSLSLARRDDLRPATESWSKAICSRTLEQGSERVRRSLAGTQREPVLGTV